jgi:activator of HSP90 ATPase
VLKRNSTARAFAEAPTRRQFLTATLPLRGRTTAAALSPADTLIHQEVDFRASPARVYEALLNEQQFSAFSGAPAQIERDGGGAFSLFGGQVTVRTIEEVLNQRIVQAWRVQAWRSPVFAIVSIVRFELIAQGPGTRLVLDHTGFPPEEQERLHSGWSTFYWDPLRAYLDL